MKTVRRLLHGEIITAVAFVTVGFLALFMFFDLVDELQSVARHASQGYQLQQALLYIALKIPEHLYQLLPLSVLIGCIFVMARLAQSSEYTILRTGGLDPLRALNTLLRLGLVFVGLTFVIGDYVAPWADRQAIQIKAIYQGHLTLGQTGAWLKENQGGRHFAVNVRSFDGIEHMRQIRIHEFNEAGQLLAITTAAQADIQNGQWALQEVEQKTIGENKSTNTLKYHAEKSAEAVWPTEISADMVAAALLTPDRMRTWELFKYMRHLSSNNQNSQRYEIEFWRKVFYPLSCLVMLVLALPFAYLHLRNASMNSMVFAGVIIGISFVLFNNLFGFIGNLNDWSPWLAAATPGIVFMAGSLAVFARQVLRH